MRKIILLTVFAFLLVLCLNCYVDSQTIRGSGRIDQEERPVESFTGVNLATFGNLYIELGRKEQLIIEAEDNLLEYFEVYVRGDILIIKTQRGVRLRPKKAVKYYLTVKKLDKIIASSSGNIEAPKLEAKRFSVVSSSSGNILVDGFDVTSLEANLSSSGNVRIDDLRGKTLQINISSSGNLNIEDGKIDEQDVTLSSSGCYRARDLESLEADVHISSSGGATIRVHNYLRASLSSSGTLSYAGDPEVDQQIRGSGRIRQIGRR
jgi:hypothetical protein